MAYVIPCHGTTKHPADGFELMTYPCIEPENNILFSSDNDWMRKQLIIASVDSRWAPLVLRILNINEFEPSKRHHYN